MKKRIILVNKTNKEYILIASKMLEWFLFKMLSLVSRSFFERVSVSFKKQNSVEGNKWLFQQYHNC